MHCLVSSHGLDWSCWLSSADWLDYLDRLDHYSPDRLNSVNSLDWLEKLGAHYVL